MKKLSFFFYLLAGLALVPLSCTREFLAKKPSKSLLVPTTLTDFQALLDFTDDMNVAPGLNVISADDFYRAGNTFGSLSAVAQNAYTWAKNVYAGTAVGDWDKPYDQVFVANVVLDGLKNLGAGSYAPADYNAVKGSALFLRAFAFYGLAQEFAADYSTGTALPGVPIRLSADVNVIAGRGTLGQTYAQITTDLGQAAALLPQTAAFKSRPCKAAAEALLARVYLSMGDYDNALAAATACLALNSSLTDYNTLQPSASRPFPSPLPDAAEEVLYYSTLISTSSYNSSASTLVDTLLYGSYAADDLRKSLYFNAKGPGNIVFKGNYSGSSAMFGGLATDEVYLVRAECYARRNDVADALADLNALLVTRWKTGSFVPFTAAGGGEALSLVLSERRKELAGRGLRWSDLRRLNGDPRFAVTLSRAVNGITYTLLPSSPNYVLPIPDNEISGSGIPQNPRN